MLTLPTIITPDLIPTVRAQQARKVDDILAKLPLLHEERYIEGPNGGGLAPGTALYSRDHNDPKLCAQLLVSPMLDNRLQTISIHQFVDEGP